MNYKNSTPAQRPVSQSANYAPNAAVAEWQVMKEMAQMMIATGFLPQGLGKPEQVIFVIMKGKEMGMGPMQALQHIQVIQGKLCLGPEGMLAQVLKHHPTTKIKYLQNDDLACTIEAFKDGVSNTFSFTIEDATKAGLASKDNWKKYTRAMLRSRCVGEMCRALFPDAIQGCSYTPDEIRDLQKDPEPEEEPKPRDVSPKPRDVSPKPSQVAPSVVKEAKFSDYGVTKENLDLFMGKDVMTCTAEEKAIMRDALDELKRGKKWDELMEFAPMCVPEVTE